MVWRDGSCEGYGRGDDPLAPPYVPPGRRFRIRCVSPDAPIHISRGWQLRHAIQARITRTSITVCICGRPASASSTIRAR